MTETAGTAENPENPENPETAEAAKTGHPDPRGGARGHVVVVVGGGLAGLAAAVRLTDLGARVTLLEARPRLGGATHSFHRDGLVIDNGQHVFLRCYTAYQGFLRRIGSLDRTTVQSRFAVPVISPDRPMTRLYRTGMPAPLHLVESLLRYPMLRPADRIRVIRAALRLRALDPDDPTLDQRRFGGWLRAQGQTDRCVRALWEPFTVSALNLPVEEASLALAAKVFRTGLLTRADAADIGFPLVPLADLHGEPAAALLRQRGATVRVSTKVTAIRAVPEGLRVSLPEGELAADAVVLAVPHQAAGRLLPSGALPGEPALHRLGEAPIVNLHVIYDRQVTHLPFAAAVDSPVQWIFDRGRMAGLPHGEGQYLAVSLSAADTYVDTPSAALRAAFLPALEQVLPDAGKARVVSFFVTRDRRATFRQGPGTRALRPSATTAVPGLVLAGAWTDTGWPDVMEGAVRSGDEAARIVAARLADAVPGVQHEQEVMA